MKYRIHRFQINMKEDQAKLELFLNKLEGEVVSIIPNVAPALLILGGSAKIDFLLIVEKIK
ncbi:MAG: hypothetical protein IPM14_01780 [bacterium]|nr:hypothetical protein [bacterium]